MLKEWYDKIQKIAFWLVLVFLIGSAFGATISNRIFYWRVNEAIKLERMLYNNTVYDIKPVKDVVKQ
jgi:hypothetical protein